MDIISYPKSEHTFAELVDHMEEYFSRTQNMKTQRISSDDNSSAIIQAAPADGAIRYLIPAASSLTLRFDDKEHDVIVKMGLSSWITSPIKSPIPDIKLASICTLAPSVQLVIQYQMGLRNNILNEMGSFMNKQASETNERKEL